MTDFCRPISLSRPVGTLGVSMFCHRTAQCTMLLPSGRYTVHCMDGVIDGHISPR